MCVRDPVAFVVARVTEDWSKGILTNKYSNLNGLVILI